MRFELVLAIGSALFSGSAAVLQSVGARQVARFVRVDPRLLWRLVRNRPYALGLLLDGVSFLLTQTALQGAPLFAVQALASANLAVVATLAWLVLHQTLRLLDWMAVLAVFAGALLLLASARTTTSVNLSWAERWAPLGAALAITLIVFLTPRVRGAIYPAIWAGLLFGNSAVAGRMHGALGHQAADLASSQLTYATLISSVVGALLYATALQRGSVTAASGFTTVAQTVGPAFAGYYALHDSVRSGTLPLAAAGFLLAISGAVALGRHANLDDGRPPDKARGEAPRAP